MLFVVLFTLLIPLCAAAFQMLVFRLFLRRNELDRKIRWRAFWWGAIGAAVLSTAAQFLLAPLAAAIYSKPEIRQTFSATLVAPLTEEFFKGLAPLLAWLWFGMRGRRKLLVLGAAAGSGFFMMESILALLGAEGSQGWGREVAVRIVALGFNHAFWTGMFGLGIGFASKASGIFSRIAYLFLGYSAAVLMHGTNNIIGVAALQGHGREGTRLASELNGYWILLFIFMLVVARICSPRSGSETAPQRLQA